LNPWNESRIDKLDKDMMYVLISLIVRPPQCRFPTSPAWTGSLVFLSPFSWRTCDVMRSLSGTPVTSIVYRCEVGSWQFSQRSPSAPPRTIAVRTPSLPHATMGHGGGGDRGEQMEAGRTSTLEHSIVPGSPTDRRRTRHISR